MVVIMVLKMVIMIVDDYNDNDYKDKDNNDKTHLNDMIIDPDASVTAGNGVFNNALHIDVQLVWDSVDHVDPNDPDAKARRRTHTSLHHKVHLHQVHFVNLLFQLILEPCMKEVVARDGIVPIVILGGVRVRHLGR